MPDLVIIDGGQGAAERARSRSWTRMEITELPVVGLAKENEEIFVRDRATGRAHAEPVLLPRTSQAMYLVQRIRDEAHRFAITYHRQVRGTDRAALGAGRRAGHRSQSASASCCVASGRCKGIRAATLEELAAVPGMTLKQARVLKIEPLTVRF